MNREDMIRMAREAWLSDKEAQLITDFDEAYISCTYLQDLEKFAALVASAEREACAKVCETLGVHPALNVWNGGPDWYKHGKECAEAIRARGQA
jgi:hypothetical protein